MQAAFDLLASCSRPFLIVGGYALAAHGVFRQTIDIDCLIAVEDQTVFETNLIGGGYVQTAQTENFARYASKTPKLPEVDVLFVDASTFKKLEEASIPLHRGKHEFRVPGLAQLIALKLHSMRNEPRREARDLADIAELLRLNAGRISAGELAELCEKFGPTGIGSKLQSFL
jgi:nucleotidyltransferase AbiEii toxin of type IV toxin-antitoxin system